MATDSQNNQNSTSQANSGNSNRSSNGLSYFKSKTIPGLSIIVGKPQEGQVAPETVRFVPYDIEPEVGERVVIGFLETDDSRAIKILKKDLNVQEISRDEYEKYTTLDDEGKIRKARL